MKNIQIQDYEIGNKVRFHFKHRASHSEIRGFGVVCDKYKRFSGDWRLKIKITHIIQNDGFISIGQYLILRKAESVSLIKESNFIQNNRDLALDFIN